ncbi:MAG: response regulator [Hyphomicrobiaceae bacterium]|nr:response regulator [Hyphomicrobiaceae bacterium]
MPRTRSFFSSFEYANHSESRGTVVAMQDTYKARNLSSDSNLLTATSAISTTLAIVIIFTILATGIFALLSAQSVEPIVLTLLSLLSMLGIFFIFGLASKQIRVSERTTASEIFERIIDLQSSGLMLVATNGTILNANQAAADLLGSNEFGELNSLEYRFAKTILGAEALFRLLRSCQRQQNSTEEIILPPTKWDAEHERWFRLNMQPFGVLELEDYSGPTSLCTITEITTEKACAARQIHNLQSELAIYRELQVGICALDTDGTILYMNRTFLINLGYASSTLDVSPRHLKDIVTSHGAEILLNMLGMNTEHPSHLIDVDFVTLKGERWPAACYISTHYGDGDLLQTTLVAYPCAPYDTCDDNQIFTSIFRTAPFGIALINAEGCVTNFNKAFARLSGSTFSMISGMQVHDSFDFSFDPFGASQLSSALDAAYRGKAQISTVEVAIGPEGEFARRIVVQSLGQGKTDNALAILFITDATEERALGQKFAQSQKIEAIGKLAGGIAHDFNNVLTAIIGFSDLLLANHRPTDHAYKNIQNIRSSANHAAGLVKQLLAFSRRQTLKPEVVHLGELVTDLSVIMNRLLGENIDLKISSGRDLWDVMADRNKLNQVFINLAVNARDAMADNGRLTLRTKNVSERESQRMVDLGIAIGQYVAIEIEDTGSGMTSEVMAKIFEPFFTTKDIGKGTGLGLSTVYGIIKQTDGYIFVDSTLGEGTTFRVYLPRYLPRERKNRDDSKTLPVDKPKDLTGNGRVLIVEDEDAVRIFATEALRRQGYEVLQACNGLEALEVLKDSEHQVDLVVSDVKMPEMDGPTLYKKLRETNPTIKFVFVSGYTDDAFSTKLESDADYTFMQKPYTLSEIAEVVKEKLL